MLAYTTEFARPAYTCILAQLYTHFSTNICGSLEGTHILGIYFAYLPTKQLIWGYLKMHKYATLMAIYMGSKLLYTAHLQTVRYNYICHTIFRHIHILSSVLHVLKCSWMMTRISYNLHCTGFLIVTVINKLICEHLASDTNANFEYKYTKSQKPAVLDILWSPKVPLVYTTILNWDTNSLVIVKWFTKNTSTFINKFEVSRLPFIC